MTIADRIAKKPPELPNTLPLMLTDVEAAEYLGVSVSYLRKSRSDGAIKGRTPPPPFVKIGGKVRYRRIDLDEWVDALETRKAV